MQVDVTACLTMQALHQFESKILEQGLSNNMFEETLLPAIVFQEWGDPISAEGTLVASEQQQGSPGECVDLLLLQDFCQPASPLHLTSVQA